MQLPPDQKDLPESWYNVVPDLPFPVPEMMSPSGYPLGAHDLRAFVAEGVIDQELEKARREIRIPGDLHKMYAEWRPTPLYRAERLERALETPARIFFKLEGGGTHSYEANTAIPQCYYAKKEGAQRVVTATGNGEWGVSLAVASSFFGLRCTVYMVRSSYEEKPHGRYLMEILGTEVVPTPSNRTRTGQRELERDPHSPGSLGLALSAAFEDANGNDDTKFCWGTVMNHVLLHQTVVGLEAKKQMRRAGARPDVLIAGVGGGSAFGGLVFPFYRDLRGQARFLAVESASFPTLTKGRYSYDYADTAGWAPLLKMYTLGHGHLPPRIRAGGMRYHGMSPLISALYREGGIEARAYAQSDILGAAVQFARSEGVIPSPESAYAIKAVVDEAIGCREHRERKNILCVISANSHLDIEALHEFLDGSAIVAEAFDENRNSEALEDLPKIPTPGIG